MTTHTPAKATIIFLVFFLSSCSECFIPHPERDAEMNDFIECMKIAKDEFPDSNYGAYICHVGVEDREYMDWKGFSRKEWSR